MAETKCKSKSGDIPEKAKKEVKQKKEVKEEPESPLTKKKHLNIPRKPAEVSIKAAKEEVEEETTKTKKGSSTGKIKVVKKEETAISRSKTASEKGPVKKKKLSKEEPEKKEKKVYSLPGQKHDPPDERNPLRIFYESLYNQNAQSEMAEIWMMEHGLLEPDVAKKAFERKKKNQLNQKLGSPVKHSKEKSEKKSSAGVKSENKSIVNGDSKKSKAKRACDDDDNDGELDDDDDDFILKKPKKKKAKTNA